MEESDVPACGPPASLSGQQLQQCGACVVAVEEMVGVAEGEYW